MFLGSSVSGQNNPESDLQRLTLTRVMRAPLFNVESVWLSKLVLVSACVAETPGGSNGQNIPESFLAFSVALLMTAVPPQH